MPDNRAPSFSYIRMWIATHKNREASSFKRNATEPRLTETLYFCQGEANLSGLKHGRCREEKEGLGVGRQGQGHTQLLHAVVDQLLFLLFVGDGLRLQLAGLWTRPRSETRHSHRD